VNDDMFLWIIVAVVAVGLFAAWLYDRRVRARRSRLGSVDDAARSSAAGVTSNPDAHRGTTRDSYGWGGGTGSF
jgi:hypothetical protein